jgi:hypothetical protein
MYLIQLGSRKPHLNPYSNKLDTVVAKVVPWIKSNLRIIASEQKVAQSIKYNSTASNIDATRISRTVPIVSQSSSPPTVIDPSPPPVTGCPWAQLVLIPGPEFQWVQASTVPPYPSRQPSTVPLGGLGLEVCRNRPYTPSHRSWIFWINSGPATPYL